MPRVRILCCILLVSLPSWGGVTLTSTTRVESGGLQHFTETMTMQAWVSGGNAKTVLLDSPNPSMPSGSYLLKRADNAALLLVNPSARTFSVWDPQPLLESASKAVEKEMKIEAPTWEKVSEEDGPEVSGFPTRHYHYRFKYTIATTVDGSEVHVPASIDQEFWATEKVSDAGLDMIRSYRFAQELASLSPDLEQMLRAAFQEMRGFPLKETWKLTTAVNDDPATVLEQTTTTVTDIRTLDVPDSVFEIPPKFTQVAPAPLVPDQPKASGPGRAD